jgi:hypothetical protein
LAATFVAEASLKTPGISGSTPLLPPFRINNLAGRERRCNSVLFLVESHDPFDFKWLRLMSNCFRIVPTYSNLVMLSFPDFVREILRAQLKAEYFDLPESARSTCSVHLQGRHQLHPG